MASINQYRASSNDSTDDNENVFNIGESIRKKNEQLKREYLELKITDPAKPLMNGYREDHRVEKIFQNRKKGNAGAANEKNMRITETLSLCYHE